MSKLIEDLNRLTAENEQLKNDAKWLSGQTLELNRALATANGKLERARRILSAVASADLCFASNTKYEVYSDTVEEAAQLARELGE